MGKYGWSIRADAGDPARAALEGAVRGLHGRKPKSARQVGHAHQGFFDGAGGLAVFADRSDDQRLAAAHFAAVGVVSS
jgi:hypothetical protein